MIDNYSYALRNHILATIVKSEDMFLRDTYYSRRYIYLRKMIMDSRKTPRYVAIRAMVILEEMKRNKIAMMYIPDISK